ncbi:thiamine pyrophosphate-binding protein [Halospeciosus flavus]|uniref:Thiamine pyrophosphate-binding protein n=1 Tax=Halospeciosus flavus TaxID=3032283 RepID=A0ABD5Z0P1_9EURY|nr:thiamine pyrophosphate-binding protein [Halospeciosus flavus]
MSDGYTGADLFVDTLAEYDVDYLFGNPGTTELPITRALGRAGDAPEYVLALHEDVAVGAAAGYAQRRRYHAHDDDSVTPVGVANLHLAPGTAHGLANIYGASVTGAPLVVTAGAHSRDFRHEEPILSGDAVEMTRQFTKWSAEVGDVSALPTMLRRAFRVALTPPTGPVFLALPLDVMMAETDAEPERLGPIPDAGRGDPTAIERAADYLVDADEPVLVVGDGVARADGVDAAVELAEATGARVHAEILTSEVDFPTDHEQWGSYLPPREGVVQKCLDTDTVVFLGCSTNTTLVRHAEPLVDTDTTFVHVSDNAWEVGKNQPADAAVVGDPGRVAAELAARLRDRLGDAERGRRLERVRETVAAMGGEGEESNEDDRPSKTELAEAIRDAVPDALVVDEGVTAKYAMMTVADFEPGQFVSNKGGGLGYGLPASVGAAVAEAQRDDPRPVLGHVGDGSYLYYPQALYTAARHDLDLTVVVPDNRNYRILKDNMAGLFGGDVTDEDFVALDFEPPVDIPANAESHGATGRLVEPDDDLDAALVDAVETDGPVVLDVLVHD